MPGFTINKGYNPCLNPRSITDFMLRLFCRKGCSCRSPKLPDTAVLLGEIAVDNSTPESLDQLIDLHRLHCAIDRIAAPMNGICRYGYLLTAYCHNLRSHCLVYLKIKRLHLHLSLSAMAVHAHIGYVPNSNRKVGTYISVPRIDL